MRPSFSLMLGLKDKLPLKFQAAKIINSDISWIAVDNSKPGRKDYISLLVHSSANYADNNIDADKTTVMDYLIEKTSSIIGEELKNADYKNIHGWRYANAVDDKSVSEFIDIERNIGVCGDWCAGGRIEGAYISAYNLAKRLKKRF